MQPYQFHTITYNSKTKTNHETKKEHRLGKEETKKISKQIIETHALQNKRNTAFVKIRFQLMSEHNHCKTKFATNISRVTHLAKYTPQT